MVKVEGFVELNLNELKLILPDVWILRLLRNLFSTENLTLRDII